MVNSTSLIMSVLGGALIGLSALFLYWAVGKIAGIQSMIFGLFQSSQTKVWRFAFLISLIGGVIAAHKLFDIPIPSAPVVNTHLLIIGAILTGVGTYLANGCTSGHGVCGIGRLSPRSLVATLTFMATGFLAASALY